MHVCIILGSIIHSWKVFASHGHETRFLKWMQTELNRCFFIYTEYIFSYFFVFRFFSFFFVFSAFPLSPLFFHQVAGVQVGDLLVSVDSIVAETPRLLAQSLQDTGLSKSGKLVVVKVCITPTRVGDERVQKGVIDPIPFTRRVFELTASSEWHV